VISPQNKNFNIIIRNFIVSISLFLLFTQNISAQIEWCEKESEHFKLIYRNTHSYLANHILNSAEKALTPLMKIFDYEPTERIVINTYDVYDYGYATATTVPENFIRLEIEPFEPGYENIPYNERFQWVLSHELVHIVVNDKISGFGSAGRTLFSKVAPEQMQPLSIFFSLLTNYDRYSPRWHQEAIAVFMETWLSGGYGRILGNFDEMYFRSLVIEGKKFPSDLNLDAKLSHNSFLLETLFYLYGGRFASYLSLTYGPEKFINWFKERTNFFFYSFKDSFKDIYKIDFDKAWNNFILNEINFQNGNLSRLKSSELTEIRYITKEPTGWVSQPFFDQAENTIIFSFHKPHHLASIKKLDLTTGNSSEIASLQTPSIYQVASTAYDKNLGLFFYTTNNNQLYRDLWLLEASTKDSKLLFKDCRMGQLTVSSTTHELWGIQHSGAQATLVFSDYPYNLLEPITQFDAGDEIQQLSISPSGNFIAAVLHRSNGDQYLIVLDCDNIKAGSSLKYKIITEKGSPDNPSWSPDEKYLFWNAYTNGVSNIYRINRENSLIEPISHTLHGLFKPIQISHDSLFAFEFTTEGFMPVIIPNKPAKRLTAIHYLGQEILNKNPKLLDWAVSLSNNSGKNFGPEEKYNGLSELKIQTFIPVITGFQNQKVLGFYSRIADPLINHDITLEFGYSPFNENPLLPKWHFKGKYEYKKQFEIGVDHNATDFYDLFNNRKRGMIGTKVRLGNTFYWVYDNPLKVKQLSELALYKGVQFINDNLVKVSEPDFAVLQTSTNSKDLRKSIGSSDFEYGDDFTATLMVFGSDPQNPEFAEQIYAEWGHYTTWLFSHNVFLFKVAGGYHNKNDQLIQARFFFGGFGNRAVENVDVKQYRNIFRFPGIPIYSLSAEQFLKVLIENNFPPVRFGNISIGQHYLSHIDFSIYSQGLLVKTFIGSRWVDIGAQINFIFKHWFNLESTLSGGVANAWFEGNKSWEWFISYKLLKNN